MRSQSKASVMTMKLVEASTGVAFNKVKWLTVALLLAAGVVQIIIMQTWLGRYDCWPGLQVYLLLF